VNEFRHMPGGDERHPPMLQQAEQTLPFVVDPHDNVATVLEKMSHTGYQGRAMAECLAIWKQMIEDPTCVIYLGLAGATIPALGQELFCYLIENRLIDVLVATGANLSHSIDQSLGELYFKGEADADDMALKEQEVDRLHDVLLDEKGLRRTEQTIRQIASEVLKDGEPVTTRELFRRFGERLHNWGMRGVLPSAFVADVPIYCPALGDSVIGLALACANHNEGHNYLIDINRDVEETCLITDEVAENTGVIYLGGGTPKNFIQQTAYGMDEEVSSSHIYAIQFTADQPQWGALSACTFKEAKSWGKISEDAQEKIATVDLTIGLPLVVTALANLGVRRAKVPDVVGRLDMIVNQKMDVNQTLGGFKIPDLVKNQTQTAPTLDMGLVGALLKGAGGGRTG
jgi:deoxyhypusine synthase